MCFTLVEIRTELPQHPVPEEVRHRAGLGRLHIAGSVRNEVTLSPADLRRLRRTTLSEPFTCEEGWTVPGLNWSGVALADVLATAQPSEQARYVRVWSDAYSVTVSLDEADHTVLCDMLDGKPLSVEHGGPWRLIVRGGQCFSSVKWVDRLELMINPEPGSAETIARQRLRP
jgi:DMSO/TMAO reductase YedYZ molybdopterin-dependent catalytic subunit